MKHISKLNSLPDLEASLQLLRSPEPPYYVVISTKIRQNEIKDKYERDMMELLESVESFPGYLGMEYAESELDDGRLHGISTIYWKTLEDLEAWRYDKQHMKAKEKGKSFWYDEHNIRVCQVLSHYGCNLTQGQSKALSNE